MPFTKQCPECKIDLNYSNRWFLDRSISQNKQCRKCCHKKRPYEHLYNAILKRAEKADMICLLTYEEFLEFTKIDKCHYCDKFLVWPKHGKMNQNKHYGYNLDRKNSSLGYTKDNCVTCCAICNDMKGNIISYRLMLKIGKVVKEDREQNAI